MSQSARILLCALACVSAVWAADERVSRQAAVVPMVAAGQMHVLKLSADGVVWSWGENSYGQLGDGTTVSRSTPQPVPGLSGVQAVAAGYYFSLALKSDGTVWTWGMNDCGQLGDGTTTQHSSPRQVSGLEGVVRIAAATIHSVAVKGDGTVWEWGVASLCYWGLGPADPVPHQVSGLSDVVSVSDSSSHTLALKNDGTVWGWGSVGGFGDATALTPVRIALSDVIRVAAGDMYSLAVKRDGTLWGLGVNRSGILGDQNVDDLIPAVQIQGVSHVTDVVAGESLCLALTSDGAVWSWGDNTAGALGEGTMASRSTPARVNGLSGVVSLALGAQADARTEVSLAVQGDGTVWVWGWSQYGQDGSGAPLWRSTPAKVPALDGVAGVSAGMTHTVVVKNDGTVWAWGSNGRGELGDGTTIWHSVPAGVSGLNGVVQVATGMYYSLALKRDGSVWAWGEDGFGQLGDGIQTRRLTPMPVSGLGGVVAIAAGLDHAFALKGDGTVWGWGFNAFGQLGDTTPNPPSTPVEVGGLHNVVAVSTGVWHSLALDRDGTVWAWGSNFAGELGDGTTTAHSTPARVSGLSGVTSIAASEGSLATKADGSVWTWGYDGLAGPFCWGRSLPWSQNLLPQAVGGLSGVRQVAQGDQFRLALKSDGTVSAWGCNDFYQLGDGSTVSRAAPAPVSGLSGVAQVSGGSNHSVALMTDGTVAVWGSDYAGQLGLGRPALQATPGRVLPTTNTLSLSRSRMSFGAQKSAAATSVTPPQQVLLKSTPLAADWTAASDAAWLQVAPSAGTGNASLQVSASAAALPVAGTYTAHVVVTSPDAAGVPLSLPVTLTVGETSSAPFGLLETPSASAAGPFAGSIAVTGWALDDVGVQKVSLWRDSVAPEASGALIYIGDAVFVPGARPDVEATYSGTPRADRAGWGYMMLTNFLPGGGNGSYRLHAIATDFEGRQTELGSRQITLDNAHAVKPFGAIDTPAQGATVAGAMYVNFGWALSPRPAQIPSDGSSMFVFIDGIPLGNVTYNNARGDIDSLFPGYANSGGAVGYRRLDTTQMSDGMHSIAWSVTDNQGHADGIGSRYFNVLNAIAGAVPAASGGRAGEDTADGTRSPANLRGGGLFVERVAVPSFRTGYDLAAPLGPFASDAAGVRQPLRLQELERVEIHLPALPTGSAWTGGLRVNGELRPLPLGSTLDARDGVFCWQLGPGFLGAYELEFSYPGTSPLNLRIRVLPRGDATEAAIE